VGVDFAGDLSRQFDVTAIIDTGDLTSFGLSAEANIGSLVSKLGVPYYFVPGNHDSFDNRATLARYADVTVLDGRVVDIAGLQLAEASAGQVPLVISGDIHERSSQERDGTLMLTVGSAGATGLGSFTEDKDRPYEAEVLHLRNGKLVALDYVTMTGFDGDFSLQRTVYGAVSG
jgi:predicted phosphodiesterase